MEILISIVLIVLVISNIALFRAVKKLQLQSLPIQFAPVTGILDCDCREGIVKEFTEIITPLLEAKADKITVPSTPDESHFAWRNQKEEPKVAPPSPHGPPPIPGPLERPYGFSR